MRSANKAMRKIARQLIVHVDYEKKIYCLDADDDAKWTLRFVEIRFMSESNKSFIQTMTVALNDRVLFSWNRANKTVEIKCYAVSFQ